MNINNWVDRHILLSASRSGSLRELTIVLEKGLLINSVVNCVELLHIVVKDNWWLLTRIVIELAAS